MDISHSSSSSYRQPACGGLETPEAPARGAAIDAARMQSRMPPAVTGCGGASSKRLRALARSPCHVYLLPPGVWLGIR
eukprot:scaffold1619_cov242-Prasinococcus_capsulatus_cf.AAC.4